MAEMAQKSHWSLDFARWWLTERPGLKRTFEDLKDREEQISRGVLMCPGCGAEAGLRIGLRAIGDGIVLATPGGCLSATMGVGVDSNIKVCSILPILSGAASLATGIKRGLKKLGKGDVPVVVWGGDASSADLSFGNLSGAAERQENLIYVCYNNEGYMNTGVQRAGTTPMGAMTTTSPVGKVIRGKGQPSKEMALLMAMHPVAYAATASIAFPEDYIRKLRRAIKVKHGFVYLEVFSPCPTGWRFDGNQSINVARLAVETNLYPLWETVDERIKLTRHGSPRRSIKELTSIVGKYRHLDSSQLDALQELINKRLRRLKALGR
jgi:pyruvate/2-oxoacid:ferredoxin oxidoreductase beta subunit